MLDVLEFKEQVLVHPLVSCGPVPTVYDPQGIYPYESYCETSRRPVLKEFRFLSLENARMRVVICPDLGGKVWSMTLNPSGAEVLFVSPVVRPVRILPRQAFCGGGIEVSFPISHTPSLTESVNHRFDIDDDRIYVWCGEKEPRFGMHWTVEYSLGRQDEFLTQRTLFYNGTAESHPWMSWSNAGVPAHSDTEFHFPRGRVLRHDDLLSEIDWAVDGPRLQSDVKRMTGYFWKDTDCSAFGVYTPSLGAGLYHVADPKMMPGIKLWTDGVGRDEAWVSQYTLDGRQNIEIQAGPLIDQSIRAELAPNQRHVQVEFWIPSDHPRDICSIELPDVRLLEPSEIPIFNWANADGARPWETLCEAYEHRDVQRIPLAPKPLESLWPPTGIAMLGDALEWTQTIDTQQKDIWRFYLGTWLAGKSKIEDAIGVLQSCAEDCAQALSGRLHRIRREFVEAAGCFRKIRSEAFALHPQVVIERDMALAGLGAEAWKERDAWLKKVRALEDEWIIERRSSLLADQGNYSDAETLLSRSRFQLVHQRYERTALWKKVQAGLGKSECPPPSWLGEDDLAEFGAYRSEF